MIAAVQRREIVPVGTELRALAWIGVMLIATGVGIVIKKNFEAIGPLAIAVLIGVAAAGCYLWVSMKGRAPLDPYIVLLGALLISAEAAFIQTQWHVLGDEWQRHFLLLAVAHAAAAYWFDSRAVLSLSIAALAAWMGIERQNAFLHTNVELALRFFLCAIALAVWRAIDRRADFRPLFEHFGTNFAFWGAVILTGDRDTRWLGLAVTLVLAAASIVHGVRKSLELYVIYGVVYALIAVDIVVIDAAHSEIFEAAYVVVSTAAAIAALIAIHFRFRQVAA